MIRQLQAPDGQECQLKMDCRVAATHYVARSGRGRVACTQHALHAATYDPSTDFEDLHRQARQAGLV